MHEAMRAAMLGKETDTLGTAGEESAEFSCTFDTPGEYRYECTPHPGVGMRGVVIVAET